MAHIVVQVGSTKFYAALLAPSGKPLPADYGMLPDDGGQAQRLQLSRKWLVAGSDIEISLAGNCWLAARLVEIGEYTRSLMVVIERPRSKPAIAIQRQHPPTLLVRWPSRTKKAQESVLGRSKDCVSGSGPNGYAVVT